MRYVCLIKYYAINGVRGGATSRKVKGSITDGVTGVFH